MNWKKLKHHLSIDEIIDCVVNGFVWLAEIWALLRVVIILSLTTVTIVMHIWSTFPDFYNMELLYEIHCTNSWFDRSNK